MAIVISGQKYNSYEEQVLENKKNIEERLGNIKFKILKNGDKLEIDKTYYILPVGLNANTYDNIGIYSSAHDQTKPLNEFNFSPFTINKIQNTYVISYVNDTKTLFEGETILTYKTPLENCYLLEIGID